MKYLSTRGSSEPKSFIEVVVEGLARDGGLFVPETIPEFSNKLDELKTLSYQELAFQIFKPYVDGELSDDLLEKLVQKSYQNFRDKEITPLCFTGQVDILELFHGPTLAFKDIALQFLGNLFEEILISQNLTMNILGATSGDTGSAAIYGVRGKERINIFMMHPKGKISPIQEKQMTTVLDSNVHNIAVKGTFDDAQSIVKEIFNDLDFRDRYHLGAVNSINWARVMAQIVYYFYATFQFQKRYPNQEVVFSVPTGNFGDIYAGYLALQMGCPIKKLILATNENDILFRAISTGVYKTSGVHATLSPSMDIQVASNFERFLFALADQDGKQVTDKMDHLSKTGEFSLSPSERKKAQEVFVPVRVDTDLMLTTISKYKEMGVMIDPHTAIGVAASEKSGFQHSIALATAHPCKFAEAYQKATGAQPEFPEILEGILEKDSRCLEVENSYQKVEAIIEAKLG